MSTPPAVSWRFEGAPLPSLVTAGSAKSSPRASRCPWLDARRRRDGARLFGALFGFPDAVVDAAQAAGADAVLAMRFDTSEVGQNHQEVVAYGTAVRLA